MLQLTSDMSKPQGLSKTMGYQATVISNDDSVHPDGMKLGRIQARIDVLFEGIPDEHLPWARPSSNTSSSGASTSHGHFGIPKVGSKVTIKFQDASPDHPLYSGYAGDESTLLPEREYNYPDRIVHQLPNDGLLIIDTSTNDLYLRYAGATNLYIVGNCNLNVDGNLTEKITGDKITKVGGDLIEEIAGDRIVKTSTFAVDSTSTLLKSSGASTRTGSIIHDNPSAGITIPSYTVPTTPIWRGIRGAKPDSASTDIIP